MSLLIRAFTQPSYLRKDCNMDKISNDQIRRKLKFALMELDGEKVAPYAGQLTITTQTPVKYHKKEDWTKVRIELKDSVGKVHYSRIIDKSSGKLGISLLEAYATGLSLEKQNPNKSTH